MNYPTYQVAGVGIRYEPRGGLTSLDWYNIANCARRRMYAAHVSEKEGFSLWKRERESFWTLTRKAIPEAFV
jgi:hypothetical protein